MSFEKSNLPKQVIPKRELQLDKIKIEKFPLNIPESQGDRADQAALQIEADLQEAIEQARMGRRVKK